MIVTRTPYRISFVGGGTDYPSWYEENGGIVLSTTINKYCYVTLRRLLPFFEHKHRIVYSVIEDVHTIDEVRHPTIREALRLLGTPDGLEIHHDGDLPARSGIGTSSSFTVGLLQTLYILHKIPYDKEKLFTDAIHLERDIIGENVGSQDQVAAAVGGFNLINFDKNKITVTPVDPKGLEKWLLLVFTGLTRLAVNVARTYDFKSSGLQTMQNMVPLALQVLQDENYEKFGYLLDSAWNLKKGLSSEISNPYIDHLYETAKKAGILGGKLLGAGGSGFMLLLADPSKHDEIKQALKGLLFVPFKFESKGSEVIFNNGE